MHPETFDSLADSLGMSGKGRDAAKDVLTAQVGTLSSAAQRYGISRPAVARQVNRIQAAFETGDVEVTITVTLGELEQLYRQRDNGSSPDAPAPVSFVLRAEEYLATTLGVAMPPTKAAAYFGAAGHVSVVLERQKSTGAHVWVASEPIEDPEIEIMKSPSQHAEADRTGAARPPYLPSSFTSGPPYWRLRIVSLDALAKLVAHQFMLEAG